jgi:leader peptidase (prepilin peptidase) / N-methyltransferase
MSAAATTTHLVQGSTTAAVAAVIGIFAGAELVPHGMAQLGLSASRRLVLVARAVGGLAAIAGVVAVYRAGSWWLLPALLVWAVALAAVAVCDAATQRVPTSLVRRAAVAVGVLVVIAAAGAVDWRWALLAAVCAAAAGATLTACWRFAGAGFGDVRLAVLGGLGLVHPTRVGILLAIAAFILITVTQAIVTLARGGNRHSTFPYGPAIATAFVLAAVA